MMRTIILTGFSRGLGKAISKLLLSERYADDYKILINRDVEEPSVKDSNVIVCSIDLSKNELELNKIFIPAETTEVIFINNASVIEPISKVLDMPLNEIDISMNVNFKSPLKLSQYLTRETKKLGVEFLIINITTGAAIKPIEGWLAYCTSKAAVKIALDVLEIENNHVKVIHFDPGVMDTDMQAIIRSSPKEKMPNVELFQDFKKNSRLKSTADVAKNICDLIKKSPR